jgi:transcriptional regulator with XRE-family HTH domain
MTRINPETLKSAREGKGWSLDDLAKRSRVDRQSIHRIETGGKKRNRADVIKNLAKCLHLTEEELCAVEYAIPAGKEGGRAEPEISQLNLRLSDQCRNALVLTSHRYSLSQASIVEIAPLLFCWAAETSLKRRRERLDDIAKNDEERAELSAPHLHGRAFDNYRADDTLEAEQKSIDTKDIFATSIDGDDLESYLSENYDEEAENPFAQFLSRLAEEIGSGATFEGWHPDWPPQYEICQAEALAIFGGDDKAAGLITRGSVSLHQMPDEIRKAKGTERAKWAHEKWSENPISKITLDLVL